MSFEICDSLHQRTCDGACSNEFVIRYEGTTDAAQQVRPSPGKDRDPSATLEYSTPILRYYSHDTIFSPTKMHFFPQSIFYPLFCNEDGRIRKNLLSELHYRFRRYSTLPKTVLLESQYLQSYEDLLQILAYENQEDCHNFADIEIQAKLS